MKPSIPKGSRDFTPEQSAKRQYIFDTLKKVFEQFGFLPIETPAMENLTTLTGKYGEEGDQLLYKILNSRLHENRNKEKLKAEFDKSLDISLNSELLTERALRYDLTVPFARFVVMHQNELTFPFKRYQIQPVWRADKPQRGRYREFYQCDVDVIGSKSLLNEIELVNITSEIFKKLGINIILKLNNRKILAGIAEVIGAEKNIIDITVAIDKLDKINLDGVINELKEKGISEEAIEKLLPILKLKGTTTEKITFLTQYLTESEIGKKGVEEISFLLKNTASSEHCEIELDLTLARGLNYYTGAIFEVKANDSNTNFTGSIAGGGRYDDLTGIFGLKDMSGVGISFGADRIYDVLEDLNLFPKNSLSKIKILFANYGSDEELYCLNLITELRKSGISCELYPDQAKIKKQFDYAEKKQINLMASIKSEELISGIIPVKNLSTGEQLDFKLNSLIEYLLNVIN